MPGSLEATKKSAVIDVHSGKAFPFFSPCNSVAVSQSVQTKLSEYQFPQYRGYFFRKSNSNQMFCLDLEFVAAKHLIRGQSSGLRALLEFFHKLLFGEVLILMERIMCL